MNRDNPGMFAAYPPGSRNRPYFNLAYEMMKVVTHQYAYILMGDYEGELIDVGFLDELGADTIEAATNALVTLEAIARRPRVLTPPTWLAPFPDRIVSRFAQLWAPIGNVLTEGGDVATHLYAYVDLGRQLDGGGYDVRSALLRIACDTQAWHWLRDEVVDPDWLSRKLSVFDFEIVTMNTDTAHVGNIFNDVANASNTARGRENGWLSVDEVRTRRLTIKALQESVLAIERFLITGSVLGEL